MSVCWVTVSMTGIQKRPDRCVEYCRSSGFYDAPGKEDPAYLESYLESAYNHNSSFDNGLFILDAQGRGLADYPAGAIFGERIFRFGNIFKRPGMKNDR